MYNSTHEIRAFSLLFVLVIIFGSVITVVKKAQNESSAYDREGNFVSFNHAWLQTAIMSLGEFACIMGSCYFLLVERRWTNFSGIQTEPFLSYGITSEVKPRYPNKCFQWSLLPSSCVKLLASGTLAIGLIYTKASIWQMLHGSQYIFKIIISKFCNGRRPEPYQYVAFLCTLVGVVFVVAARLLGVETRDAVFGIVCSLLGQFFLAIFVRMEGNLLKGRNFHPMSVIGVEGFFGFLLMLCVVLPVTTTIPKYPLEDTNLGRVLHDNMLDGLYMIQNDLNILYLVIAYLFSTIAFNSLRAHIASSMTPIHKALIEPLPMAIIWCVELSINAAGPSKFGVRITYYSILEFGGLVLILTGSLIANKLVRLHYGLYREKTERVIEVFETPSSDLFTPVISSLARSGSPPLLVDTSLERRTNNTLSEAQVVT